MHSPELHGDSASKLVYNTDLRVGEQLTTKSYSIVCIFLRQTRTIDALRGKET